MARVAQVRGYDKQDVSSRSAVLQRRLGERAQKAEGRSPHDHVRARAEFIQRLLTSPFVYEVHLDDLHPTGLFLEGEPPGLVKVRSIDADAPDFMRSIEAGDYIVAVNGLALQQMSAWEVTIAMQQRPLWLSLWRSRRGAPPSLVRDVKPNGTYPFTAKMDDGMLGFIADGAPRCPLFVQEVMPKSIAAHQGVEVGDQILQINGKDVTAIDPVEVPALLRARPLGLVLRPPERHAVSVGDIAASWPMGAYEVVFTSEDRVIGIIPGGWSPHQLRVDCVVKHSAGESRGVRVGDVLLQVNNRDVVAMSRAEIIGALCERPVTLLLQHGSLVQPAGHNEIHPEAWATSGAAGGGVIDGMHAALLGGRSTISQISGSGSVPLLPPQQTTRGQENGSAAATEEDRAHQQRLQSHFDQLQHDLQQQQAEEERLKRQRFEHSAIGSGSRSQDRHQQESAPHPSDSTSTLPQHSREGVQLLTGRRTASPAPAMGQAGMSPLGAPETQLRRAPLRFATAPQHPQVIALTAKKSPQTASRGEWPGLEGMSANPPVMSWSWAGPGSSGQSVPVSLSPLKCNSTSGGGGTAQGAGAASVRERAARVARLFEEILD